MLRRLAVPVGIAIVTALAVAGLWRLFAVSDGGRLEQSRSVSKAPSALHAALTIVRRNANAVREEYRMDDVDGRSSASYTIESRSGVRVRVSMLPSETHLVAFFFEQLVSDGVWELENRPPRGNLDVEYSVSVAQTVDHASGSRRYSFTDPHYWATTGGHQFHIHLERDKPIPNLLHLSSTTRVEPRYEKIVADFEHFGNERFLADAAQARTQLRDAH